MNSRGIIGAVISIMVYLTVIVLLVRAANVADQKAEDERVSIAREHKSKEEKAAHRRELELIKERAKVERAKAKACKCTSAELGRE